MTQVEQLSEQQRKLMWNLDRITKPSGLNVEELTRHLLIAIGLACELGMRAGITPWKPWAAAYIVLPSGYTAVWELSENGTIDDMYTDQYRDRQILDYTKDGLTEEYL